MFHLSSKGKLLEQVSSKSDSKKGVKKLVLVSTTSTPVTGTREEAVEDVKLVETIKAVETAQFDKHGEESKGE